MDFHCQGEVLPQRIPLLVNGGGADFRRQGVAILPVALQKGGGVLEDPRVADRPARDPGDIDAGFAQQVASLLHGPSLRAYSGTDVLGAELGGAMKNVLAVATGAADGMQLGLNARAGLITRGMNEMLRLGVALGARAETLMGLAGLGDLVLTCTGDLSRNRRLGMALGRGVPLAQALADIGQVVESVFTAEEVVRLAERVGLDLPISFHVRAVLRGEMTPDEGLRALLAREQKPEYPEGLFGPGVR